MQLHHAVLMPVALHHLADAELLDALFARPMVVTLADDHVAAVAAAAIEITSAHGVLANRGDDFDELIADGEDRVLEPECLYARVAISDLEAEYIVVADVAPRGRERRR